MDNIKNFTPSYELPDKFMAGDFVSDCSFINLTENDIRDLIKEDVWKGFDSEENSAKDGVDPGTKYVFSDNGEETLQEVLDCEEGRNILLKERNKNILLKKEMKPGASYQLKIDSKPELLPSKSSFDPSLSLVPWSGDLDFNIRVKQSKVSSKFRFSDKMKKLYVRPYEAVPVQVKLSEWIVGGWINISPVYTNSQFTAKPVVRCFNHKQADIEQNLPHIDHLVQLDNPNASYRDNSSRYSVDIPLMKPPPGEDCNILYTKCVCLSSCGYGHYRKQFCLVYTLFDAFGKEIGRQILDLKVCSCPIRDCENKEKMFVSATEKKRVTSNKKQQNQKVSAVKKIKLDVNSVVYEQINIPVEIAADVKRYANSLVYERYAKENGISPLFPGY